MNEGMQLLPFSLITFEAVLLDMIREQTGKKNNSCPPVYNWTMRL